MVRFMGNSVFEPYLKEIFPFWNNISQTDKDLLCNNTHALTYTKGSIIHDGADCSGFVQSVYAHFGVSLPRTTYEMVNSGYAVSYAEALPGDLILYDGHVGLYMGDGTIVNAMNEADGIGICSATYTNIIAVRRVL